MSTGRWPFTSWVRQGRPAARPRAALAALCLLAAPGPGRADAPVTWALYDAPPFMIADGPERDGGIFDRIRHLLDARLSNGSAPTLRAPFPRVVASLKAGADLCFIGGVKTPEREHFAVFSLPVAMFYPLRIVVRPSERGRFEAEGKLSLARLLADRSLRTSFLRDRALGGPIDTLVREAAQAGIHSEFGEAFRMLLTDRLDYLVEYSAIAAYQAKRLEPEGAIAALPFDEAPAPLLSRVMCPNTDWGRRLVARIDDVLRVERTTPAFRQIVEAWAEESDRATIREVYDRTFLASE